MKQLKLFITAALHCRFTKLVKVAGIFIFIIASLQIHAQEIAGEMDLTQQTYNKKESSASADLFKDADFKIYPNPAKEVINIQSKVKLRKGVTLTFCDITGTILEKRVLEEDMEKNELAFNISEYTVGQYIIGIRSIDGSFVAKKIIKR
ncbi:MAG: T9SS type A sorting domain-containing protein [Prolixibacteraceae bacterium]|nr:T9SS type A sorting domain-containing protein [Prolixibacteraceae bacterium]MBN2774298.1 T9SS type A sorting domain-containing protein [Prolixibacteraceae bacterium]